MESPRSVLNEFCTRYFYVCLIAAVALFLCGLLPMSVYSEERQVFEKEKLPVPKPGLGHAIGQVRPTENGLPVNLLPKSKEKPKNQYLKPVATTDENGEWVALNIKPGHYFVLYSDPKNETLFLSEDDFKEIKAGSITKFNEK